MSHINYIGRNNMFSFDLFDMNPQHRYSFASIGLGEKDETFTTRPAAERHMYDLCDKHKLSIREVYDDKHDKTYICNKGVSFYIQRM